MLGGSLDKGFETMRNFFAAILLIISASAARAEFGDCTSVDYLRAFPDAPTIGDLNCIELFRIDYESPAGPRAIRAITDISSDWAVTPAMITGIERGARAAIATFPGLGDYAIGDVTILLMDGFVDRDETEILALTDGFSGSECLINQLSLVSAGSEVDMAVTAAHEIFHCLQYATLSPAQMTSYNEKGQWWIEGSAEFFAALAVPDGEPATDRGAAFSADVDAGTPLYDIAHSAVVFFDWYISTTGPAQLVPFMRGMAADGSAASQRAAMRGVLSDEKWLDFAKAYADGAIRQPAGGAVSISPSPGQIIDVIETADHQIVAQPFAITLVGVNYDCGTWVNRLSPAPNLAFRVAFSEDWGDWTPEIDTREAAASSYDVALMHTGDDALDLTATTEQIRTCQPCAGVDTIDICVGGTWEMASGGPIAWMQAQGMPINNVRGDDRIITFLDSGAYVTAPFSVTYDTNAEEVSAVSQANAASATGRWSVSDGRLNICLDAGGFSGRARVTFRDGQEMTIPVASPAGGEISMAYTCSGDGLNTTMTIPGAPPMDTGYSRAAE